MKSLHFLPEQHGQPLQPGKDGPAPNPADFRPETPLRTVTLPASEQHPEMRLFEIRKLAQEFARFTGGDWAAIAFRCGYLITNGWNFHDARGPVDTFCPVPPDALPVMQELVTALSRDLAAVRPREQADLWQKTPPRIFAELSQVVALRELSAPRLRDACTCTLLRIRFGPYRSQADDWLNMPAWALKMPTRTRRLDG